MPLDIGRFRRSDLVTEEDPEAVLAAILLWGVAWHEVPAASVPDNDRWLAKAAGYGRAVDAWLRVRTGALRGFVRCSDGRLYHRTLAEKANAAWDSRLRYEWQKASDRHRKAQRDIPEKDRTKFPDFDDWKQGRKPEISDGHDDLFRRNDPEIPAENALKGREGKGREGNLESKGPDPEELLASAMRDFREHRVKIKAAMTPRAETMILSKLESIREEHGHDPVAVLNQSIMNGWRGVFPLKEEQNGGADRKSAGTDHSRRDGRDGFARAVDRRLGIS